MLAVVPNGQRRANFHRALGGGGFRIVFRLLEKVNCCLIFVRLQKIGSFIQTSAAHRAGYIDVPSAGNVLGLLTVFVRHGQSFNEFRTNRQCLSS